MRVVVSPPPTRNHARQHHHQQDTRHHEGGKNARLPGRQPEAEEHHAHPEQRQDHAARQRHAGARIAGEELVQHREIVMQVAGQDQISRVYLADVVSASQSGVIVRSR